MAPERVENNPYENGFGVGGKLRKTRFRRSQATPYDRPQAAIRNPIIRNDVRDGWLAKLVDPARRVITSTAHTLFSSIFRKRLPPHRPSSSSPQATEQPDSTEERRHDVGVMNRESGSAFGTREEKVLNMGDAYTSNVSRANKKVSELAQVEDILRQKTFTRSEIERLTSLLRSKTVDASADYDEQKTGEIRKGKGKSYKSQDSAPDNIAKENGHRNQPVSDPLTNLNVLGEEIPVSKDLAKGYMCSDFPDSSPLVPRLQNQMAREDPVSFTHIPLTAKTHAMSQFSGARGQVGLLENGFVTPRSHNRSWSRSALYSMVRTPYSRPSTLKAGLLPSSSRTVWEEGSPSGSKLGNRTTLKRRSTILESDMGSIGPVRRVRQKSNLLSARNSDVTAPQMPLSMQSSDIAHLDSKFVPSSKKAISGGPKSRYLNSSSKITDNESPAQTFATVPSKSSEVASKILQELDKLVSSRDKSPTKLSPSMLHGPALKSLQSVDSMKFLSKFQDEGKTAYSSGSLFSHAPESGSPEQKKVDEGGSRKLFASNGRLVTETKGVDVIYSKMDNVSDGEAKVSYANAEMPPAPKRKTFRMSAEDFLDVDADDDDQVLGVTNFVDERDTIKNGKMADKFESGEGEKALTSVVSEPSEKCLSNGKFHHAQDNGSMQNKGRAFVTADVSQRSDGKLSTDARESGARQDVVLSKISIAVPSLFEEKVIEPTHMVASVTSVLSDSLGPESSIFSYKKPDSAFVRSTEPVLKAGDSNKCVEETNSSASLVNTAGMPSTVGIFSTIASSSDISPPPTSLFMTSSHLATNFVLGPAFSTSSPTVSGSVGLPSSTNGSMLASVSAPTSSAPVFKFMSSPTSVPQSTELWTTKELKEPKDTDSKTSELTYSPFGGAPSVASTGASTFSLSSAITIGRHSNEKPPVTATANNIFGTSFMTSTAGSTISGLGSSSAAGTSDSMFGVSSSAVATPDVSTLPSTSGAEAPIFVSSGGSLSGGELSSGGSIFGFPASSASSTSLSHGAQAGFAAPNKSTAIQFGSSNSTPSIGLTGNPSFASSSSGIASSSGSTLFGYGSTFASQQGSFALANSTSTSNTTTSGTFGSGWQNAKAPVFGSSFATSSPGFVFGASSDKSSGTSTPALFSFSSTTMPASQPLFGNGGPGLTFNGSTPNSNGNNDQMSMEDSMAEDTDQAKSSAAPFGQVPVMPPTPSFFGAAAAPSVANPFQFGSQGNLVASQSQSPFQTPGSMEFNAGGSFGAAGPSVGGNLGGSFSLGSGGGDKSNRRIVKIRKQQRKR